MASDRMQSGSLVTDTQAHGSYDLLFPVVDSAAQGGMALCCNMGALLLGGAWSTTSRAPACRSAGEVLQLQPSGQPCYCW